MIKGKYLNYNQGQHRFNSIIDALHAANPNADLNTGKIVRSVIKKIDASGIISLVSRDLMDLNRPINNDNRLGILEYRRIIRELLVSKEILNHDNSLKKRLLHISIHGMNKTRRTDFEIGTRNGESCNDDIKDWFCNGLKTISPNIGVNNILIGDSSKAFHRLGDVDHDY